MNKLAGEDIHLTLGTASLELAVGCLLVGKLQAWRTTTLPTRPLLSEIGGFICSGIGSGADCSESDSITRITSC